MRDDTNPFHELYVTETIRPQEFVGLFSPFLVKHALALYRQGNVVLRGTQGSGKSMLLHLLKPEIRAAYFHANEEFPVPEADAQFIGCGINLRRSLAIEFGQRSIAADAQADLRLLPLYFGDFLNYWIVRDLFRSLESLANVSEGALCNSLGIDVDASRLDTAASTLASEACWSGYLEGVSTHAALIERLDERLGLYRKFLNYNIEALPESFGATKTIVSEPISRTVHVLRGAAVLPAHLNVFVRIDQYEELNSLEDATRQLGSAYRQIINKALGTRDPNVSYRIGSRRYAWATNLEMYGTTAKLELDRDYRLVDIDELLRRKESRRTWIFPAFGEDVFRRRIQNAGYDVGNNPTGLLVHFFGNGLQAAELAERYVRTSKGGAVSVPVDLPEGVQRDVQMLASSEPFEAQLLCAWYRQKSARATGINTGALPSKYWRKERVQLALMQLAAKTHQRMIWAGADDILSLSGGNILIFIDLCQQVWSAGLRARKASRSTSERAKELPSIDPSDQSVGIHYASLHWYQKITEQQGGDSRQRFVDELGALFRSSMLSDVAMSYPGHNGFSLRIDQLREHSDIELFLNDCVDFGDLADASHTTKMKDRKPRRKWYLNPILSPHFNIPVTHVKEPMYVSVDEVKRWMQKAQVPVAVVPQGKPPISLPLFDDRTSEE